MGLFDCFLGGLTSHRDLVRGPGRGKKCSGFSENSFDCVIKKCLLLCQVIKLLEKELDSYKEKEAEPTPDVVS